MSSSWVSTFILLLLCFSFNGVSSARHHRRHPHTPAVLVGTVYCDTCFPQKAPKSTHFISGATVAVECGGDGDDGERKFREEVKTNDKGEFEAKLPDSVGKDVEKIKGCSVKLISSGEKNCAVAATATASSSEIRFKSKKSGAHVFSAGFFTFKPELCDQKDFRGKDFPPSLPDPSMPFLPPVGGGVLPSLPVPDLPIQPVVPPLPELPGIPLPPITQKPSESDKFTDQFGFPFPPNPFQPTLPPLPLVPSPPSIFPPLPLQPSPPSLFPPLVPSPPPSLFPPVFPSPPASIFPPLPFPPVPGLIPSSPPPPPPAFPVPLPPLPPIPGFPPIPGLPPVPPASTPPKTAP